MASWSDEGDTTPWLPLPPTTATTLAREYARTLRKHTHTAIMVTPTRARARPFYYEEK